MASMVDYKPNFGGAAAILQAAANVIAQAERERLERLSSPWQSFMASNPEAMQVVLVMATDWKFPKVLQFVPYGEQHRLYEVNGPERYYYYPERMRWMPIPPTT